MTISAEGKPCEESRLPQSSNDNLPTIDTQHIPIVFIIDSSFVMPLAVALRSLLNHFDFNTAPPRCEFSNAIKQPVDYVNDWTSLRFYIVGIGLSELDKEFLNKVVVDATCPQIRPSLSPLMVPEVIFIDLPKGECPLMTKLQLPNLLPLTLPRILYLDADILVRANIKLLWCSKVVRETKTIAAVVDVGKASSSYFNAGLLVMNLEFMRHERVTQKILQYVNEELEEGLKSLPLKEQDVLNMFFADPASSDDDRKLSGYGWHKLSIYWNVQGMGSYAKFRLTSSENLDNNVQNDVVEFTDRELKALESQAYIVHFTGSSRIELSHFNEYCPMPTKPWSGLIFHPSSLNDDTDNAAVALNPYVFEWYSVLYSIPEYRGWLPTLMNVSMPNNKAEDVSQEDAAIESMESRLQSKLHNQLTKLDQKLVEMKASLLCLAQSYPLGYDGSREKDKIAILLPITSKSIHDIDQQLASIKALALSLPIGMTKFYVGVDDNDVYYSTSAMSDGRNRLLKCFTSVNHEVDIMEFPVTTPPHICGIVRSLAECAYKESEDNFYFLLLGDDVVLRTPSEQILPLFRESFALIAHRCHSAPYGFGCVAFHDETSLGFPTFPVVTRVHLDMFGANQWCPEAFINQDADPYLFELYRTFQASLFSSQLILRNTIGGANQLVEDVPQQETRYIKHHINWQDDMLQSGMKQIQSSIMSTSGLQSLSACVRLDIIVPSFRIQRDYLQRIVELPVPPNCSTTVIVILDNPDDPISQRLKEEFEEKYREKVRIRVNAANKGASYSRSRGLDESCADWILFLDDDVIPSEDLLFVYCEEIARSGYIPASVHNGEDAEMVVHHQGYVGYVGATHMPNYQDVSSTACTTSYTKGIQLVHLLHFWSDHVCASDRLYAPWGITAQLCIRRLSNQRFNECFPKTGGGEDIDLCLRTCSQLNHAKLKNLPAAKCLHPWWNQGHVAISRFYGWAKGDSLLVDLYPEHCYRSYPNGIEMMIFVVLSWVVAWMGSQAVDSPFVSTMLLLWLVIAIFTTDIVFDLFHIMKEAPYHLPALQGWERCYCGLQGLFFYRLLGADVGHVLHPLFTRGSLSHLCLRFDWWCGLYPQDVKNNKARERDRFCCMITVMFLTMYFVLM